MEAATPETAKTVLCLTLSMESVPEGSELEKALAGAVGGAPVKFDIGGCSLDDLHQAWVALAGLIARYVSPDASAAASLVLAVAKAGGVVIEKAAPETLAEPEIIPSGVN
jgi:hypothetical protein